MKKPHAWILQTSDPARYALAWQDELGQGAALIPAFAIEQDKVGSRKPLSRLAQAAANTAGIHLRKPDMAWLVWLDADTALSAWIRQEILTAQAGLDAPVFDAEP